MKRVKARYWLCLTAKSAGISASALGLVVLFGWLSGNTFLLQVQTHWVPMQAHAAVGFVLSGLGVLLVAWGRRRLAG